MELNLTDKDLEVVMSLVRANYLNDSVDMCLPGKNESMNEQQFSAMCWLKAVGSFFVSKKLMENFEAKTFPPEYQNQSEY
jgi:hypothetical protein